MSNATIEDLFASSLGTDEPNAPVQHHAKTADCPSFARFELHATGTTFLSSSELRHVNRCPDYCQPTLERFRELVGPALPCPEIELSQRLAAHEKSANYRMCDGIYLGVDGKKQGNARLVITDGPLVTETGYLAMRISVVEPAFKPEMMPLRLALRLHSTQKPCIFTFDLPSQSDEVVKLKIDGQSGSLSDWKTTIQNCESPFVFTLCALGKPKLIGMG